MCNSLILFLFFSQALSPDCYVPFRVISYSFSTATALWKLLAGMRADTASVSNNVLLWVIPSRRNRIHAKTVKQTALLCRSMLETDGVGFIRHRASFYQLLRQNNPVAPPLPKLCCANPIRSGNAWVMGKKMKRPHNIF